MKSAATYLFSDNFDSETLRGIEAAYKAQGWWSQDDSDTKLSGIIKGSHCFLAAVENSRVVGIGRAISDGISDAYIHDVTVLPEARGQGIGSEIVRRISLKLKKDGIKWIGLIAQDGSEKFYQKLDFKVLEKAAPMLDKNSYV